MSGMMIVLGTRPEAIKLIPVVKALQSISIPTRICVTGQHRELLSGILEAEGICRDFDLDLMSPETSLGQLAGRMIAEIDRVLAQERPDRVIVQGDTSTTLAAAQAAYYRGIPVAHVEAGLRTGNLHAPFPEEGNRRMISAICDLHFAPSFAAVQALENEGHAPAQIYMTGNTVVDALISAKAKLTAEPDLAHAALAILERCIGRRLILVTCHRRESVGALADIAAALAKLSARPDVQIVVLLHPNPAIHGPLISRLEAVPNVAILPPLASAPFVHLLSAAYFTLTDSGGLQEEAPVLGVPVLVMRDTTERPEGVSNGIARLVGTQTDRIVREASRLLDDPGLRDQMARRRSLYGDGNAAKEIARVIAQFHGYISAVGALGE